MLILTDFTIVYTRGMNYNNSNKYMAEFLECSTACHILILHFFEGIPISLFQCQASLVSGRQRFKCGYPPSVARSRRRRERHAGNYLKNGWL